MTTRAEKKEQARTRILSSAARLFRENGIDDTSVSDIMAGAGMTHGGFYAHFKDKSDLVSEAFSHAAESSGNTWFSGLEALETEQAVKELINSYLSTFHRDTPGHGCPLPTMTPGMTGTDARAASAIEHAVHVMADRITHLNDQESSDKRSELAIVAMLVGGVMLSRAVDSDKYSREIIAQCRAQALEILARARLR